MRFVFRDPRDNTRRRPARHLSDVEIIFDGAEPDLEGLKLVGTALWRGDDGGVLVTLPARKVAHPKGGDWFYDLLRAADEDGERITHLKGQIIAAYQDRDEDGRRFAYQARCKTNQGDRVGSRG